MAFNFIDRTAARWDCFLRSRKVELFLATVAKFLRTLTASISRRHSLLSWGWACELYFTEEASWGSIHSRSVFRCERMKSVAIRCFYPNVVLNWLVSLKRLGLVIVEIINFDIEGITSLKKSKSMHWKSNYCTRSSLSTPHSKDE